jgi:L-threonylcarbamoyladenylate synthase
LIFSEDIKNCLTVLRSGGVILYPTDTIWGLGCDATSDQAVQRIFNLKGREEGKSLLVLVNGIGMLERYVREIPGTAGELISISDSPLTIIYPGGRNLAEGVCATDGSAGIRICNEEFCNELITLFRKPIVSTSANLSGNKAPAFFGEIDKEIIEKADYVVRYRQKDRQKNASSPIIRVEADGSFKIIRK